MYKCAQVIDIFFFLIRRFYFRWDIQRYRALKQREELQEKHKQREDARLQGTRKVIGQEERAVADDSFVPNCFESKWEE